MGLRLGIQIFNKEEIKKNIVDIYYWEAEIRIPLSALDVQGPPDGSKFKMNFCRTWRNQDELGLTNWIGTTNYNAFTKYGDFMLDSQSPYILCEKFSVNKLGDLTNNLIFKSPKNKKTIQISISSQGTLEKDKMQLIAREAVLFGDKEETILIKKSITNDNTGHLVYDIIDSNQNTFLRHAIPYFVDTDFLMLTHAPTNKLFIINPRYRLLTNDIQQKHKVMLEIIDPDNKTIYSKEVTSDEQISYNYKAKVFGKYNFTLKAVSASNKILKQMTKHITTEDFSYFENRAVKFNDVVLPPFEPLKIDEKGEKTNIACWGRNYAFSNSIFPQSIESQKENLLKGPISIKIDGSHLEKISRRITKNTKTRIEMNGKQINPLGNFEVSAWMEYDGVIFYTLTIHPAKNLNAIELEIPFNKQIAQFLHATKSGMSSGGGITRKI
ncbi:MAG: glycoside hydrolase domain-containing protein, partial [Planctomycetota bacterium]